MSDFFYYRGEKRDGPVSLSELTRMLAGAEISADDTVWDDERQRHWKVVEALAARGLSLPTPTAAPSAPQTSVRVKSGRPIRFPPSGQSGAADVQAQSGEPASSIEKSDSPNSSMEDRRIGAVVVDGILVMILANLLPGCRGAIACVVASSLIFAVIMTVTSSWRWHATPGELLHGLMVRFEDGSPLTVNRALYRSVLFVSLFWLVIPVLPAFGKHRRALHDLLSETLVFSRKSQDQ